MKKVILFLILASCTSIFGQTKYFKGTFEESLKKANVEGKKLLLIFENEYCMPCKKLKALVFDDKGIGDFINSKYIVRTVESIVKLENDTLIYQDTPDGKLAKKYECMGFPMVVILDSKDISNPKQIIKLSGMNLGVTDPEVAKTLFPIDEKYQYKVNEIKKIFELYAEE
jgi:thioredoxin-related protein